MGKAYANKKILEERNKNEYYPTPKVLDGFSALKV